MRLLGEARQRQGEYSEAESNLERALEMCKANPQARESIMIVPALLSLGGFYKERGRSEEALALLRDARDRLKKLKRDEHPMMLVALRCLEDVYSAQGDVGEAEECHTRAAALFNRLEELNDWDLFDEGPKEEGEP